MIADILKMMECQESRLLDFVEHISQAFPVDEDDEGRFPCGGKIKLNLGGLNVVEVEEVTLADCAWDEKVGALFSHMYHSSASRSGELQDY